MDTEKYEQQALTLRHKVDSIEVVDNDSFVAVGSIEQTARDNQRLIKEHLNPQITEAHSKHRKLTQLRNRLILPFEDLYTACRHKRIAYQREQEHKAKLEQEAKEAEAKQLAEQARIKQAEKLEKEGKNEQAEAVIDTPIVEQAVPKAETVKVAGIRKTYYCEINSIPMLFTAYATEKLAIPELSDKDVNDLARILKLNSLAKALKSSFSVPGCVAKYREG